MQRKPFAPAAVAHFVAEDAKWRGGICGSRGMYQRHEYKTSGAFR
jgi:hypothetical protein